MYLPSSATATIMETEVPSTSAAAAAAAAAEATAAQADQTGGPVQVISQQTGGAQSYADISEALHAHFENQSDGEAPHMFVVKIKRPDSKLILRNMEAVLNSVERHDRKHRRKKEQRRANQSKAMEEAANANANAAAAAAFTSSCSNSPAPSPTALMKPASAPPALALSASPSVAQIETTTNEHHHHHRHHHHHHHHHKHHHKKKHRHKRHREKQHLQDSSASAGASAVDADTFERTVDVVDGNESFAAIDVTNASNDRIMETCNKQQQNELKRKRKKHSASNESMTKLIQQDGADVSNDILLTSGQSERKTRKQLAVNESALNMEVDDKHGMPKSKRNQHFAVTAEMNAQPIQHDKTDLKLKKEKNAAHTVDVKSKEQANADVKPNNKIKHSVQLANAENKQSLSKAAEHIETAAESNDQQPVTESTEIAKLDISPTTRKANAFEVLMKARHKTIGSNTPGREPDTSPLTDDSASKVHSKRKLALQEWADRKGGAKRKLEEESRAAYVEQALEQRAKRLKQMLVSGASPTNNSENISQTTPTTIKADNTELVTKRKRGRPRKTEETDSSILIVDYTAVKEETLIKTEPTNVSKTEVHAENMATPDTFSLSDQQRPVRNSRSKAAQKLQQTTEQTADDNDFLSKLSSPIKKRDSLLGYFPKKESSTTVTPNTIPQKLPQLRVDLSKSIINPNLFTQDNMLVKLSANNLQKLVVSSAHIKMSPIKNEASTSTCTSTSAIVSEEKLANSKAIGRPRRSCIGKRNLEETEVIASECKQTLTRAAKNKSLKNTSIETIELDDSIDEASTSAKNTPKKLAPLFVRTMPKPTQDPDAIIARKAFLHSGVPEKLRLEMARQKQFEQNYDDAIELFPKVNHINQHSSKEHNYLLQRKVLQAKLRAAHDNDMPATKRCGRKSKMNLLAITDCTLRDFQSKALPPPRMWKTQPPQLPRLQNKRAIIKSWKVGFDRFPTFKCYNQMREKYRHFSAIDSAQDTEQVAESFVVTRQTRRSMQQIKEFDPNAEEEMPPETAPNGELLFTEKYKPLLFEQMLVNLNPVTKLRDFLAAWNNTTDSTSNSQQSADADADFDINNESRDSIDWPTARNAVVLLGPVSSGKTSAVFAVANDMNFNVLEINAGMKRTGKKLLQELQEATQSHQIRKDKTTKNLVKMSVKATAKRKKRASTQSDDDNDDDENSITQSLRQRKCLILIEDADIIFEQTDAGFVDAINTLTASSKRPVILTASNANCAHLQRLMQQNCIEFAASNPLNVSRFLSILTLIENCPISIDDLMSLYLYNRKDLRKTLLEIQFFVQSGGDRQLQFKQHLQTPPRKQQQQQQSNKAMHFFASPSNQLLQTEECIESVEKDEQPNEDYKSDMSSDDGHVYIHRKLFDFYTLDQNTIRRVPFPLDFAMLRNNLSDLFQVSQNLKMPEKSVCSADKRKKRLPKHNGAAVVAEKTHTALDDLCNFYENISVAAVIDASNCRNAVKDNEQGNTNGLMPNLSQEMVHTLTEQTLEQNLHANNCAYNLFDNNKPKNYLHKMLQCNSIMPTEQRSRHLDYEAVLRNICRSESSRPSQKRRSARINHYLHKFCASSFSTQMFNEASKVLQEEEPSTPFSSAANNTDTSSATDALN